MLPSDKLAVPWHTFQIKYPENADKVNSIQK